MNNLGLFGIGIKVACDAVVKAHTNGNEQVAFVGFDIGTNVAVHTQHTFV